MNSPIKFDKFGYVEIADNNCTLSEVHTAIDQATRELNDKVRETELVLQSYQNRLSCMGHSRRTIWLLFKEDGKLKK